jgi:hypothetical protein
MKPKKRKHGAKDCSDGQLATNPGCVSTEGAEDKLTFATDEASRGLKFVDVTPRYLQGTWNTAEQKSIRIHVMQDFLRQKKNPVDVVEPPAMGSTVSSHVHRFRIAKDRPPADNLAGTTSSQKAAVFSEQSCRRPASRSSSTPMRDGENLAQSEMAVPTSTGRPSQCETLVAGHLCIWVKWAPNLAVFAAAFCCRSTHARQGPIPNLGPITAPKWNFELCTGSLFCMLMPCLPSCRPLKADYRAADLLLFILLLGKAVKKYICSIGRN